MCILRKDNFLESDWSDGDTVFCASTCFSDRLLDELFEVAEKLKCGSRLITSRVPSSYDSSQWAIEKNARCEMSWGRTEFTVFVRL